MFLAAKKEESIWFRVCLVFSRRRKVIFVSSRNFESRPKHIVDYLIRNTAGEEQTIVVINAVDNQK